MDGHEGEKDAEQMGDEALAVIQQRAHELIDLLDRSGFPRDPVSAAALLYVGLFGLRRAGFSRARALQGVASFTAKVYEDGDPPPAGMPES
jgi:hypothetical protein